MSGVLSTYLSTPFAEWKLISTVGMLVLTLVCSYAPWVVRSRFRNSKLITSYLNCLAGGVVLGALLMHMVPEITHGHDHAHGKVQCGAHKHHMSSTSHSVWDDGKKEECCGNKYGGGCSGYGGGCSGYGVGCSGCAHADHDHMPHINGHSSALQNDKSSTGQGDKQGKKHEHHHDEHHNEGFSWGPFSAGISFLMLLAIDRLIMHSHSHDHDHGNSHLADNKQLKKEMEQAIEPRTVRVAVPCPDIECGKIHSADPENDECASCHSEDLMGGCHMDGLDSRTSKTQALVFVIALSMHSFLEGLGMASKNTKESLIMYLTSLFVHKWLEAFALGVNVLNAGFSQRYAFLLISSYSILTPVGIVSGIVFEQWTLDGPYADTTLMILNGLALGSFMFVSCIEMIPPEFHKKTRHTPWKFLALFAGFGLMAVASSLHSH